MSKQQKWFWQTVNCQTGNRRTGIVEAATIVKAAGIVQSKRKISSNHRTKVVIVEVAKIVKEAIVEPAKMVAANRQSSNWKSSNRKLSNRKLLKRQQLSDQSGKLGAIVEPEIIEAPAIVEEGAIVEPKRKIGSNRQRGSNRQTKTEKWAAIVKENWQLGSNRQSESAMVKLAKIVEEAIVEPAKIVAANG